MARYGHARASTATESDPRSTRCSPPTCPRRTCSPRRSPANLASRKKLDAMLAELQTGNEVMVTQLRRIGHSHQHLLELVRGFGETGVDFVVLEEGIGTTTSGGLLVLHFLAAMAEYDRELIVDGRSAPEVGSADA
ncbi:recombinase family protein [Saccharothrix sp. NRRL B-16348]|uniref:recombinase family protein n=1 Tax=Saccharothrix sp. NRRL B-16348 TaxID=1415542 RepID=UPI0022B1F9E3|nr:recombinase family protein [Saccharothrix sp. NRRL B-16348]